MSWKTSGGAGDTMELMTLLDVLGIIGLRGPGIQEAHPWDLALTILDVMGVLVPIDMDGKPCPSHQQSEAGCKGLRNFLEVENRSL